MPYSDVISTAQAKAYLKIDPDVDEDDLLIDTLVESALQYIEGRTNQIVVRQPEKVYTLNANREVRVYDTPVNAVVKGIDRNGTDVALTTDQVYLDPGVMYVNYRVFADVAYLVLDVGHTQAANVPSWVTPIALALVQHWYNDVEEDRKIMIPARVINSLERHRRFTI